MAEYPHIRVSGGPRERGRSYGEQASDRISRSIAGYQQAFGYYAGWDWPRVRAEADRFADPIGAAYPDYLEEMRGIAEGADVDFGDILAINVRTEVMFAARARDATTLRAAPPAECTSFALAPTASATGATLLGQNWDWLTHCFDTVVVLEAEQDGKPNFVTVVEAGLLAKAGLNSAGLGLCTNALVTDRDTGAPGLPYHVLLRAILDCETTTEALVVLQHGTRSSAANYLLGHADGSTLDVEAAPGDFTTLSVLYPEQGLLVHANHFLAVPPGTVDYSLWAMPDSALRYGRARTLLQAAGQRPGREQVQRLLADHAGHPSATCCHPDPREHPLEQGATVASVLIEPAERRLWIADGNPCTARFRRADYAQFLAGDPARPSDQQRS
ncbi:MAG: C45 family autoproteolytic acyltransferase/hydrolase [Actinomycetota bacterium]|nr:C45 family autoproteolytic acyltransferase/hydrolase [Actinomycetota bacterium]